MITERQYRGVSGFLMLFVVLALAAYGSLAFITAVRLGLYFANSPEFWMNLQTHYDLKMARQNLKPADAKRIKASRAA